MVVVDPPVLDDLELLIERDAGWTEDLGAVKPEFQKEWKLLQDEFTGLLMTVPTNNLGLVTFRQEVVARNR